MRVTDLTPAGAEPHDLELNPKQVDQLETADLIAVMGRKFQPAVEDVAARREAATLVVLDALGIPKRRTTDPHVWLDPALMTRARLARGAADDRRRSRASGGVRVGRRALPT